MIELTQVEANMLATISQLPEQHRKKAYEEYMADIKLSDHVRALMRNYIDKKCVSRPLLNPPANSNTAQDSEQ